MKIKIFKSLFNALLGEKIFNNALAGEKIYGNMKEFCPFAFENGYINLKFKEKIKYENLYKRYRN